MSDAVRPVTAPVVRRVFKHPAARPYNRLIVAVVAANLVPLSLGNLSLDAIGLAAQANLTLALVIRQEHVVNLLYRLAACAPTSWPLRVRWALAKVYHFGGVHVGAAVCGTVWYLAFVAVLTAEAARGDVASWPLLPAYAVIVLLLAMLLLALPPVRTRAHDAFEVTHRFCGWAVLVFVWVGTLAPAPPDAPTLVLLAVGTSGIALPWLRLRRVPIRVLVPSPHVAMMHVDGGRVPFIGSVRAISRHPLVGWHSFATLPAPGGRSTGYRLAVSRAGDWTARFIDDPPRSVWVRGAPVAGIANVRTLFTRVVFVATGSGIGPTFGHLLAGDAEVHLVWVTRDPRRTYGDAFVDEILAAAPGATIWNTDTHGKPDVFALAHEAYVSTRAQAVICISNRTVTRRVVHGLERLGVPAFGPIWDS
jgi:hypothetical protein